MGMSVRKVISRSQNITPSRQQEFKFTKEMMHFPAVITEENKFIARYREQAWDSFEKTLLPSTQDEAWRRTDIKSMDASAFQLADNKSSTNGSLPEFILQPLADDHHLGQILLLPEGIQQTLDQGLVEKGVVFEDLFTAEVKHPELLRKILGKIVRPDEGKFAAMAAALAKTGVFLYVPQGVQLDGPLHSVLWGVGKDNAYFSHILVYLEAGSSVTYIHESASLKDDMAQMMHAGIVEIHVGEGANLRFVELQSWGEQVWNFSHERARVERDGNLDWIFGAIGSKLTKNFSDLDLTGQGAVGRMSGFYFTENQQHLDHDTQQNHLAPNTTSDLLFKGALKDQSRSVWQGMIYVAPGAQKTDGYQANRNLILSPKARADSIPGLEILADDVRCTHGATVGKIDENQRFYLLSRGIPRDDAEKLIVEGFFDPIMQRIPFTGVRERFHKSILEKMG
jgi:Fe-S cluster assembly protein SufD